MNHDNEGALAARLRQPDLPMPTQVWERATAREAAITIPLIRRRPTRLLAALVVAGALTAAGGGALAISYATHPAEVHGKPMTGGTGGSFAAHQGWPGHDVPMSPEQAGQLGGFHVLTLQDVPGATLLSSIYSPQVVPASEPAPHGGGYVSLVYSIKGIHVQINEGLDRNPKSPYVTNQKVPQGYTGPLCTKVETILGGQYIVSRCPNGTSITWVTWETVNGVDVSVVRDTPGATGKGGEPVDLPQDLVQTIITHLR